MYIKAKELPQGKAADWKQADLLGIEQQRHITMLIQMVGFSCYMSLLRGGY